MLMQQRCWGISLDWSLAKPARAAIKCRGDTDTRNASGTFADWVFAIQLTRFAVSDPKQECFRMTIRLSLIFRSIQGLFLNSSSL